MRYRGEKKNSKVRIFYGGKGTTKIELIETSGDKNIYDRFYEKHGEAVHHVMYMTKDLDKTVREFSDNGFQVLQDATITGYRVQKNWITVISHKKISQNDIDKSTSSLWNKINLYIVQNLKRD